MPSTSFWVGTNCTLPHDTTNFCSTLSSSIVSAKIEGLRMLKGLETELGITACTSPANLSCLRAESPASDTACAWQCMLLSMQASARGSLPACETAPVNHMKPCLLDKMQACVRKPHLMEAEHFRSMLDKVASIYPRTHCPSMHICVPCIDVAEAITAKSDASAHVLTAWFSSSWGQLASQDQPDWSSSARSGTEHRLWPRALCCEAVAP